MHLLGVAVVVTALGWIPSARAVDLGLGLSLGAGEAGIGADVSASASSGGVGLGADLSLGDRGSGSDSVAGGADTGGGPAEAPGTPGIGDGAGIDLAGHSDLRDTLVGAEGRSPADRLASPAVVAALAESHANGTTALLHRCGDIVSKAAHYDVSLVALCGILQAMNSGVR